MRKIGKKRPWGAIISISLAGLLVLFCFSLSVWVAYRVINPWASSYQDIRHLESVGARYYKTDALTSAQYDRAKTVYFTINRRHIDQALNAVKAGRDADPNNSLFYYLEAAAHAKSGDMPLALKSIRFGNRAGNIHLYASSRIPANKWRWPEMDMVNHLGKGIVRDPNCSKESLLLVLRMSQKMLWCTPSDITILFQSLDLRQLVAKRLITIAEKEGDVELAKMCKGLIDEGKQLREAIRRSFFRREAYTNGTRAWTLARAFDNKGPKFRNAAYLAILEDQAQRAAKLREENLQILDLEDYGR